MSICQYVLSTRGWSAPITWGEQHEDDDHDSKEDAFFALAALDLMKVKLKLEHVECWWQSQFGFDEKYENGDEEAVVEEEEEEVWPYMYEYERITADELQWCWWSKQKSR